MRPVNVITRHADGSPREVELTRGERVLSKYFDEYLDAGLGCNAALRAAVLYTAIHPTAEFSRWLTGAPTPSANALDDQCQARNPNGGGRCQREAIDGRVCAHHIEWAEAHS